VDCLKATAADAFEFDAPWQSDLDCSRRVHEKSVVIEGRAKRDAMWLVREHRCDGQRDVLRCGTGAQLPQWPGSKDPTGDAVQKPSLDESSHQVGRRLLGHR
jgi:hypothetical protein